MRTIILTTATVFLLSVLPVAAQGIQDGVLSADDFLSESQGGSVKIQAPAEITVKDEIVTAATMQDAANKAE